MQYLIAGGGAFGTRFLRKLNIAHRRKGFPVESIVVIDNDAGCLASKYIRRIPMARLEVADLLRFGATIWHRRAEWQGSTWVPAPVAPHLIAQWIKARVEAECGVELAPVRSPWKNISLPFAKSLDDGRVLLSHAPGLCHVNCTEPASCAITGGARWWEMKDTISRLTSSLPADETTLHTAVLFGEHHYAKDGFAVGGIAMRTIYDEADRLCALGRAGRGRIGIATISSCHGVVNLYDIKPAAQLRPTGTHSV